MTAALALPSADFVILQRGRADFGDGRGEREYRLLRDMASEQRMIAIQDEIVGLIQQLPECLAQSFADRLKALAVRGYIGVLERVGETETAGATLDKFFRWAEVRGLADFVIALRAEVARLHDENSTVGCDKATVGVLGRGVESRPGCADEVTS